MIISMTPSFTVSHDKDTDLVTVNPISPAPVAAASVKLKVGVRRAFEYEDTVTVVVYVVPA